MKTPELAPFEPAEKRRVVRDARDCGFLAYDDLDRLLLHAAETKARMTALLRSLSTVRIVDARDPDDMLKESLGAPLAGMASSDDYRRYADQVRTLRRLTRAEEHTLARRFEFTRERLRQIVERTRLPKETRERIVEHGVNCESLRLELQDLDELSGEELEGLVASLPCESRDPIVQNVVAEFERLRSHFVERNLYLVIGMSSAYRTYGLPVMDLIQEGNASLIRAVEKFDWRKNVRFQTYAAFWVRQAIERLPFFLEGLDHGWTLGLGIHQGHPLFGCKVAVADGPGFDVADHEFVGNRIAEGLGLFSGFLLGGGGSAHELGTGNQASYGQKSTAGTGIVLHIHAAYYAAETEDRSFCAPPLTNAS